MPRKAGTGQRRTAATRKTTGGGSRRSSPGGTAQKRWAGSPNHVCDSHIRTCRIPFGKFVQTHAALSSIIFEDAYSVHPDLEEIVSMLWKSRQESVLASGQVR